MRLTRKQWEALGSLMLPADLGGRRQLHPKTAEKLIALGFVEAKEILLRGRFPVRVIEHRQTLLGNIAYCQWCGDPPSPPLSAEER